MNLKELKEIFLIELLNKCVKELIAIKKINTIKKLMHIHKFYVAGVPVCN